MHNDAFRDSEVKIIVLDYFSCFYYFYWHSAPPLLNRRYPTWFPLVDLFLQLWFRNKELNWIMQRFSGNVHKSCFVQRINDATELLGRRKELNWIVSSILMFAYNRPITFPLMCHPSYIKTETTFQQGSNSACDIRYRVTFYLTGRVTECNLIEWNRTQPASGPNQWVFKPTISQIIPTCPEPWWKRS